MNKTITYNVVCNYPVNGIMKTDVVGIFDNFQMAIKECEAKNAFCKGDYRIVENYAFEKEDDENWRNKVVICLDNTGEELHFEKGVEYLCLGSEKNHSWCLILDMNNDRILVLKKKFTLKGFTI